jgi:Bacterial Ig-like domain (group 3)
VTADTYPITAALRDNGAEFRAVFTNSAGTANTAVATLGVTTTTSVKLMVARTVIRSGRTDTLTAVVTSPVTGRGTVAVGTVAFSDGSTVVATAPVVKGKAKVVVTLAKGAHPIQASYSGAGAVLAGRSQVVTVTAV